MDETMRHGAAVPYAYQRLAEGPLLEALQDTPAVLIHGSRQSGKTTLARSIGRQNGYHYITFDDDNQLQAARLDPVGFVHGLPEKTILDEIQRAPGLFPSLKKSIDQNRKPGRFILTGSANILLLPQLSESLAGRMEIIQLRPLARCEIAGQRPQFLNWLFHDSFGPNKKRSRYERLAKTMAEFICVGGYPEAVARTSEKRRRAWHRDFIATILQRDVHDVANVRNLDVLPKLMQLAASQSARLSNISDLAAPFSISRPTIAEYIALLEQLFLVERLQPWHSNRISRLIKRPKTHMTDTGLATAILGINAESLWADKTTLGQYLETFVFQELQKQALCHDLSLAFFHFRNKDKVEVDLVIEAGQHIAGVEIKASATVIPKDFKGLIKIRDACGDRFRNGVVFYDGEDILAFGDRLYAVPLSVLAPPA